MNYYDKYTKLYIFANALCAKIKSTYEYTHTRTYTHKHILIYTMYEQTTIVRWTCIALRELYISVPFLFCSPLIFKIHNVNVYLFSCVVLVALLYSRND